MSWVGASGFSRRPVVVVEDHLHHVSELLAALDDALLAHLTVVCLDRSGPDTERAVARWLAAHPDLQVAASPGAAAPEAAAAARRLALEPELFANANRFCRALAGMIRPGGLLLQDVQLATLSFLPADHWWESIYLATTVRGMFSERPPTCRFLSNKRGYEATFGRDLLDAGFDPRDVLDKNELARVAAPAVRDFLERGFPLTLVVAPGGGEKVAAAVARGEEDRREVEAELDLVFWCGAPTLEIGGRLLAKEGDRRRLALKEGSHEALTWRALIADRLAGGDGVPVLEVGRRLAPEGAGRAEQTNLAARHIHGLRARLQDGAGILTVRHAYRLADSLRIGQATPRVRA
jgi:hypothetical protein